MMTPLRVTWILQKQGGDIPVRYPAISFHPSGTSAVVPHRGIKSLPKPAGHPLAGRAAAPPRETNVADKKGRYRRGRRSVR